MTDVFLSYARDDEAVARRVAKGLEAAGHSVWWDTHLPAHRSYTDVIEERLGAARAVVVLWSVKAAQSQWVRAEADFARSHGKLVQARIGDAMPPMPFNQIQCADLKGWKGGASHAGWSKLTASLAELISGEEPAGARVLERVRWWQVPKARWLAAAGVLMLLLAALLVPQFTGLEDDKPVVAVLPFESLDRRDESLVAGIWEDTRQAIGRNPQLLVLGPNTAEEIADKGSGTARKLADYLVEASVRSLGNRIRISANLVRTKDGTEIWNKSFDRKLDDVFALQSEIAGEIEGHIRGRLARRGGIQPENIATSGEVYALYSDARTKIRKRQMGKYEEAAKQLQQVVKMDPNFAPGWATLAVIKNFGFVDQDNDRGGAEANARRAIALAPNLAAGHAALGFILGKSPVGQASLKRALALDPNDIEALHWMANSLDPRTQAEEQLRLYSEVVQREPLWWPAILNRLNTLFAMGDFAAVEQELARVERLDDPILAAAVRSQLLAKRGDLSGAVNAALSQYRRAAPDDRELLKISLFEPLFQLGHIEAASAVIPPPPAPWIPLIRKNDPRALDIIEATLSPKQFWKSGPLPLFAGRLYLLSGHGDRLAKQYRAVASNPEQFEELFPDGSLPDMAPLAALALRSVDDDAEARRLLQLAETAASKDGITDGTRMVRMARIYAVQGRTDEALQLLATAIRGGWLPNVFSVPTDIGLDPPLAELRKDPRFERLRQRILGHIAKERAELGQVSLN